MWEIEKMLVTSIFSFSHNIFKGFFLKIVKRQDMVEKGKTEDIPVCNAFLLLCNCLTGGRKSHREKSHGRKVMEKKKSWGKIVMEKRSQVRAGKKSHRKTSDVFGQQHQQATSPFPTVFSKDLYSRYVKSACLRKG